jgi:hypothetical protein
MTKEEIMDKLNSKILLKIKIIEILSNESTYLSTQQLTERLGNISVNTVRLTCLELQQDFEKLYTEEEAKLIISTRHGIQLLRKDINIQLLVEDFFMNDLSYKIYQALFLHKEVSTLDFCEQHFISKSTLARYLKRLNRLLAKRQLRISLSDKMILLGPISKIRSNYQYYFFMVHRRLDRLTWFPNTDKYLKKTKKILAHLNIDVSQNKLEALGLMTLIFEQTAKHYGSVSLEEPSMQYHSFYQFTKKPTFLTDWSEEDWQFFTLSLYSLNIGAPNSFIEKKATRIFKKDIDIWLTTFEKYLRPLTSQEKTLLAAKLDQQIQFHSMFLLNNLLLSILGLQNFGSFNDDFPMYHQQFELFWEKLTQKATRFKNSDYHKLTSFLACTAIIDPTMFNPTIKLFIHSESFSLHKTFMEKRINYFLSQYNVLFVSDYQDAQLIISTTTVFEVVTNTPIMYVYPSLTNVDLQNIETRVNHLFPSKNPT